MSPDWQQIAHECHLTVRSVTFLGEGWNARAYLLNDELIARVPKRADLWPELDYEIKFLSFAADRLPLDVPRYIHVDSASRAAPHGFAIYRYLPGAPLDIDALSVVQRKQAAERIAEFLRALHGLTPPAELAALLPRDDARAVAEDYRVRTERDVAPKLTRDEQRAMTTIFERYLNEPAHFAFTPVVLHADLSREHILVKDGNVSGVIDFGDVNWGDVDYDFLYPFNVSQEFAIDIARRYGHSHLDQLRVKLHYYDVIDQVGTILDGAGLALPGQEAAAWRRLRELLHKSHQPG